MDVTEEKWVEARVALRYAANRFTELLSTLPDSHSRATEGWSVAQTAAHVASLAWACTTIADPERRADRDGLLDNQFDKTTVDNVRDFNDLLLRRYVQERDLAVLSGRLRQDVTAVLAATDGRDPTEAVDWLGGSRLPLAGLIAHLTNELQIHGWDIARAARAPWRIPPRDAALFFELFIVGVTRYGYGGLLDGAPRASRRRIAVRFRSRYTAPTTLVLDGSGDGTGNRDRVTVERPRPDDDVRLHFHPPSLNLMLFGRISVPRVALTGRVVVWGPRPWLLPAFLRTVHMPNN
jgi:Mycothiol maleylpyruvate isomerase N-terminal domain